MTRFTHGFKSAVGALLLGVTLGGACLAQAADDGLDDLFDALRQAGPEDAGAIEDRIWSEWSKSGSPSMDLLLERGRAALEAGEVDAAIGHFSALIDYAPGFAEAYNGRATAYFQKGLYGPSLEDIRQTLVRNPRHFGAIGGLALILEEIGETEGALEAYRALSELHPQREGLADAIDRLEREVEGSDI